MRRRGVGYVSRVTGVPERTLQAWSDRGLLEPDRTTRRSRRRFRDEDVFRAAFLRSLREEGIELRRAARALERFERRIPHLEAAELEP